MILDARKLDRAIDIERPVPGQDADAAGSGTWAAVARGVRAEVQDVLPSRVSAGDQAMMTATRRARVRMRYRPDLDASMRFVMGARVMQIIAGPAEIGRREGLEFMVEDYTPAGNAA